MNANEIARTALYATRVAWCKTKCTVEGDHNCDGGSAGTYVKRVYALRVAVAMHGAAQCHCGRPVTLWDGEVDRTVQGHYRAGAIVMTCHDCNNDRMHVAFDSERFANDVFVASQNVEIPTAKAAKAEWQAGREIGKSLKSSPYAM